MMLYVQYFNGENMAVGGDSCLPLDGRVSMRTASRKAIENASYLRGVGKRFTHYQIMRGTFGSGQPVNGKGLTDYGRTL